MQGLQGSQALRGIVCSVEYDDLLRISLEWNKHHFDKLLVVTAQHDKRTRDYCIEQGVDVHVTDAFYKDGAKFNKGAAIEEAFDVIGREGWMLVWDADTLFPKEMSLIAHIGGLYTPHRHILEDVSTWSPELDWSTVPLRIEQEHPGYFQLFHAADPVLRARPWYGIQYKHAGGCDSVFQSRWAASNRLRPDFNVLHLGPHGTNWYGRVSERVDGEPTSPEAEQRRKDMEAMYENRKGLNRRGGHASEKLS